MKISKIACVALLGASFAISSAFAAPSVAAQAYNGAKEKQEKKADAFNKVMTQVKILQGISQLNEWDGTDGANISDNDAKKEAFKKISDAVKAIGTELDNIKPDTGSIELEAADGASKITINNAGTVNVNIDANGGKQEAVTTVLKFDTPNTTANIAKIFDGKNANVWNEFINKFADKHAALDAERDGDIQTKALALVTAENTETTYDGTVKNYDALNKALKNDIAAKEKVKAEKEKGLVTAVEAVDTTKITLKGTSASAIVAQDKAITDAAGKLAGTEAEKKQALKDLIDAGVPVKDVAGTGLLKKEDVDGLGDGTPGTNLATVITAAQTAGTGSIAEATTALAASKALALDIQAKEGDIKTAKDNLADFQKNASSKDGIAKVAGKELDSYKTNTDSTKNGYAKDIADAQKVKAEKEKGLVTAVEAVDTTKITLKGTSASAIVAQDKAITDAAGKLAGTEAEKKQALKDLIDAGVPVKDVAGTGLLKKEDVDGLGDGTPGTNLATVITAAQTAGTGSIAEATTALAASKALALDIQAKESDIKTATEKIAELKARVKESSNTRAKAIATSENLNKGESDVLTALSDIFDSNARVEGIIGGEDADDIAEGVNELHSTLDTATKSLNKGNFTDIVIFNTNLATNTRLAKLSNPYNGNLALAYAVKNMAGEKFADNGSDALSSVVKEYTNRYNYDNNLWGNVFGGKAKVKDAANTDVYGFTLGYDKAFDNTIVGGFFTLAKAQSDGNNVKNDADNYSFGVYTRSYFGQNELDSKFAYGFAKNTLKTKSSLIGDNEGKYDSKYFDIALDYGYVFDIGNAKFVKPIFGLEYTNLKNDSFTAGGPVELNFAKTSVKTLNAKLGAEFRAYTEKGDYFYVTPGIERELSKSADDSVLNFAGSRNVTFDADKKKYTYATLKTGAEFKITDSLSTNINFGVKARSKNQFYNGTLGLSYKF